MGSSSTKAASEPTSTERSNYASMPLDKDGTTSNANREAMSPRQLAMGVDGSEQKEANLQYHIDELEKDVLHMEFVGVVHLEADSIYGEALALPQVARSCNWNRALSVLAIKSYIFLACNILLQGALIMYIGEAANVMDPLAGKVHLCDYGRDIEICPGGANCEGPGGTQFAHDRIYSFDIWSTRNYVRDALLDLFPDKKEEIMTNVDPGEYGLENYTCRMLCTFLFILVEVKELSNILNFAFILAFAPTDSTSWVTLKEGTKEKGLAALDFQISGIPLLWKIFSFVSIIVPKAFLWYVVMWMGFKFLMETSEIVNLVLGTVAMGFVLEVDEIIFDTLTSKPSKDILERIEPCQIKSTLLEGAAKPNWGSIALFFIPRRLIFAVVVFVLFLVRYYNTSCTARTDGSMVSQPMYMPGTTTYSLTYFVFGGMPKDTEPYWTMPS